MASLDAITEALATQITNALGTADPLIEDLQVTSDLNNQPTPPSIDIYPGDPFQEPHSFGKGNHWLRFTVRAREHTADHQAGQGVLRRLIDPTASTSLVQAIVGDRKLNGTVQSVGVENVSGYELFQDVGGEGNYMGFRVTILVYP